MHTQTYECLRCRKRVQASSEEAAPRCCDQPMAVVILDHCTLAATPEHARMEDADEPCDDGRAG